MMVVWAAFHAAKGKEKPAIAAKKGAVKKAPMKTPAVRKTAKTARAATETAAQ